jgi:hypothetical protein
LLALLLLLEEAVFFTGGAFTSLMNHRASSRVLKLRDNNTE